MIGCRGKWRHRLISDTKIIAPKTDYFISRVQNYHHCFVSQALMLPTVHVEAAVFGFNLVLSIIRSADALLDLKEKNREKRLSRND